MCTRLDAALFPAYNLAIPSSSACPVTYSIYFLLPQGPEGQEKVPEPVLQALQTAEDAFRCCMSTKDG